MKNEKCIEVLNTLVEINNDRIEGYETASNETKETDLKELFNQFIQTSKKCKQELVNEIQTLGGTPTEGTKTSGKLYRVFMDLKSAVTGKDRKAILNSCEYGEDVAIETYESELNNNVEDISTEQQSMINEQLARIRKDHDKVKTLRDTLVEQD